MKEIKAPGGKKIELLAETSWEVCNKIGGIYAVLSTKARVLQEKYGDKLVFLGPDVWDADNKSPYFIEDPKLFNKFEEKTDIEFGITVRTGRWDIPGSPQVILIKFNGVFDHLNDIFGMMWERFGVNSYHEYGDYREGCAFAIATALTIKSLFSHLGISAYNVMAHFNEWTTSMGLLYLNTISPEVATVFTTHATSIGRSICGNGKPLYDYFHGYNGDQMATELNMEAKHSLEKTAAHNADCFTAVSEVTAKECEQLLDIKPQAVTPNGFEPGFVPGDKEYKKLRKEGRAKLFNIAKALTKQDFADDSLIVATSGRNEYRNKGIDLFIDSLLQLQKMNTQKKILALILVPAWVKNPSKCLIEEGNNSGCEDFLTHNLYNEDSDTIAVRIRNLQHGGELRDNVRVIYVPCYLDGNDGIFNISYYDILPAIDITVFPSYYEPWGYTPLESVAFGIPTLTTDKSGFGQWVLSNFVNSIYSSGVRVVNRTDSNYHDAAHEIARQLNQYAEAPKEIHDDVRNACCETTKKADWKFFIFFYYKAFLIASERRDERISKNK